MEKLEKIPKLAKIVVFPRKNYSMNSLSSIASKKLSKKDLDLYKFQKNKYFIFIN